MADPLANTLPYEGSPGLATHPPPGSQDPGPRVVAGRYEILGLLGAGGMGNVYRARDRELDEVVALKVLRPEIAGSTAALERFRREVKLARRVTHPNVARVFDIGDSEGEKYLTMELVDGEPLGALLARMGRLPVARATHIAAAVCAGLSAAHEAGVVHRDLKPDNVLITRDGRVVVTDFGIARAAASADAKITGALVGTPAYMAPEQVEGAPVDARADIYALGAMLYELLTGEAPWQGESVLAVAAARLLRPPPDVRAKRPDLSVELANAVTRCMARSPEDRFATAQEAAESIAAAPAAALAPSLPPAAPERAADLFEAQPCQKEVAVLPFRNVGPPEHEHVAEGLTEELIDLLSMASGLRVRSRGTVMRYRGGDRDPREIGRELRVSVVVEGSVRRDAGQVRVAVRLVSVADGVQIWHRRFDRPEAELFAIGDAAARAISEALTAQLTAPQRVAPQDSEAIDLYLRARSLYLRFFADIRGESVQLLERAMAIAPDDPRIVAGYAFASARFWTGRGEIAERARKAAEVAVQRAPNLPESHVALATILYKERRYPEAIVELKRALHISPRTAEAHDLMGRLLSETTLQAEAKKHLETALELEPEYQLPRTVLARWYMLRHEWAAADEVLEVGLKHGSPSLPTVARMCIWTGDVERARRVLRENEGRDDEAIRLVRILLETVAFGVPPWGRAPSASEMPPLLYAFTCQLQAEGSMFLGDAQRALSSIEMAESAGVFDVAWMDGCPLFDPLRGDERFGAARERIAGRARLIEEAYLSRSS